MGGWGGSRQPPLVNGVGGAKTPCDADALIQKYLGVLSV